MINQGLALTMAGFGQTVVMGKDDDLAREGDVGKNTRQSLDAGRIHQPRPHVQHPEEEARRQAARKNSLNRFGKPEELANAIVFLCSERASYITGVSLNLDGGRLKLSAAMVEAVRGFLDNRSILELPPLAHVLPRLSILQHRIDRSSQPARNRDARYRPSETLLLLHVSTAQLALRSLLEMTDDRAH